MRGWGDGSASRSVSTCRFRSNHLFHLPLVLHGNNRVVIIPCDDG
jgi:hypothetical protein